MRDPICARGDLHRRRFNASEGLPPALAASRPLHACTARSRRASPATVAPRLPPALVARSARMPTRPPSPRHAPCTRAPQNPAVRAGNGRAAAPARACGEVRRECDRRPSPRVGECVPRATLPPSPRHVRCLPPAAVSVRASRATDVARLPPRGCHLLRDLHRPPPAPRHVRCRPPAAVTVNSAQATDVTRLPPRQWRVHRESHPPALAASRPLHARGSLSLADSPATVAPRLPPPGACDRPSRCRRSASRPSSWSFHFRRR